MKIFMDSSHKKVFPEDDQFVSCLCYNQFYLFIAKQRQGALLAKG